jgi:urea transport system substrate-binding protein
VVVTGLLKQQLIFDGVEAAYFGVHLWAQAVEEARDADAAMIRHALRHQVFDAPEGMVWNDPDTQHTSKISCIGRINAKSCFEAMFTSQSPIAPIPHPNTGSKGKWGAFLLDSHLRWGRQWASPGKP